MPDSATTKRTRRSARTPNAATTVSQDSHASHDDGHTQAPPDSAKAKADSKIGQVVALLQRAEGATLAEMVAATSWQPHTTRAALTGLKKKGHPITRDKRDEVTCYRIVAAA